MNTLRKAALAAALSLAFGASQAASTAIINARIFTADKAGVIERGTVLIVGEKIAALGPDVKLPAGATLIDAAGKIVTPGMFAPLSGLGVVESEGIKETNDRGGNSKRYSAALDMADAFNPRSTRIPMTRVDGVTRAMVSPSATKDMLIAGQGAIVSLGTSAQWLVKPQAAMFAEMGEAGAKAAGSRAAIVLGLREAFEEVRNAAKARQNPNIANLLTNLDVAALKPVLAGQMPLVVGAHRASDIKAAMTLAAQYKIKLVIDGGEEAWMLAAELARAKVPVIINPEMILPEHFESLGARADNAKLLQAAGVMVSFTSGQVSSHNTRNLRQLGGLAINGGMEPQAALAALTINPARMYGVDASLGSLAVGKQADVVLWDGDPFELTSYPTAVFISGERMPTETRETALRDRYMEILKLK